MFSANSARKNLSLTESVAVDCILGCVGSSDPRDQVRVEYCDILRASVHGAAIPGKGCIRADPLFRDPANLDFRLMPGSPCIGKASDGGDIGVRYTPEMIELCEKALELPRAGILKF